MKMTIIACVVSVIVMMENPTVQAAQLTFEFSGYIDSIVDPDNVLDGIAQVGHTFSGTYTFDSTTPDLMLDPSVGSYGPPGPEVNIMIDALIVLIEADNSRITVVNNGSYDSYSVARVGQFQVDTVRILELGLHLEDDDATVFNDDSLPLTPPDLSEFEDRLFTVQGEALGGSNDFFIHGEVTKFVPEPGAVLLFLSGFSMTMTRRGRLFQ